MINYLPQHYLLNNHLHFIDRKDHLLSYIEFLITLGPLECIIYYSTFLSSECFAIFITINSELFRALLGHGAYSLFVFNLPSGR